jgi:hypothetical protein
MRAVGIAAAVLALAFCGGTGAAQRRAPRYLDAVRQELSRLGVTAACEPDKGVCAFRKELAGIGAEVEATVSCSDETSTVYVAIPRLLVPADREGPKLALARRLLDLNARLVTAKLEWDALSGAIRLTTVLSTDTNFDRKAFRSQVRALFAAAERLLPELEALAAGDGEPAIEGRAP